MKIKKPQVNLRYVGTDFWCNPVYQVDDKEAFVKDLNQGKGALDLYWSCPVNDFDGEPNTPFKTDKEIVLINTPQMKKMDRFEKKFTLAVMIAANQYVEGKRSVEWLDFASGIHDLELTKELLAELKEEPMPLVHDPEKGWIVPEPEPKLKEFTVPVTWCVSDEVTVKATSFQDAVQYVLDNLDEIPLGTTPEYVDGSYEIDDGHGGNGTAEEIVEHLKEICWDMKGYETTVQE